MQLISDNFTELRVCVLVELNRYRERRMAVEYECCGSEFFIHIVIIVFLVLFAGSMSGLTLGLMSMSLVDLKVLAKSGTPNDRKHAGTFSFLFFLQNQFNALVQLLRAFWKILTLNGVGLDYLILFPFITLFRFLSNQTETLILDELD